MENVKKTGKKRLVRLVAQRGLLGDLVYETAKVTATMALHDARIAEAARFRNVYSSPLVEILSTCSK